MGPRDRAPIERNAAYDRVRDLPRLLPLWPPDLADTTPAGLARLVARLIAALRRERQRGLGRHWSYDLARHRALAIALREEQELLRRTRSQRRTAHTPLVRS